MRKFFIIGGFLILSICATISCQHSSNSNIDDDLFVQIYCDVASVLDLVEADKKDALRDSILNNYGVTYEEYQLKLNELKQNPEKWMEIYDKIIAELQRRIKEVEEKNKAAKEEKSKLKTARPLNE